MVNVQIQFLNAQHTQHDHPQLPDALMANVVPFVDLKFFVQLIHLNVLILLVGEEEMIAPSLKIAQILGLIYALLIINAIPLKTYALLYLIVL